MPNSRCDMAGGRSPDPCLLRAESIHSRCRGYIYNIICMSVAILAQAGRLLQPMHGHDGIDEAKSSELKACLASGESRIGGGLQPLYLLFLLGSLWDHFAPGVPHQGPWCTSPGQWLSWPKGDGVKCSRSEGPRRESRSRGRSSLLVG